MVPMPIRFLGRAWWWVVVTLLVAGLVLGVPGGADATRLPSVQLWFEGVPESVGLGATVDLVLRVTAIADAPDVSVEVVAAAEYDVVGGPVPWAGALAAGQTLDLPLTLRLTGSGEYSVGAVATNRMPDGQIQQSSALVSVIAAEGTALLDLEPHFVMKLRRATDAAEFDDLGVAEPQAAPVETDVQAERAAGVVRGTVRWTDCEGRPHPVRFAQVDVFEGPPGGLLRARTTTDASGRYAAAVMTEVIDRVSIRVYTQDGLGGGLVNVYPTGQLARRFHRSSGLRAMAAAVVIDLTLPALVRGTPGHPSADSIEGRAFSVFDAMVTHAAQAVGLLGGLPPPVFVEFPIGGTSNYARGGDRRLHINRQDAMDWDVLGHEFFHFLNHQAAPRQIANSPGGPHSGRSAIGEGGRNRDEGMRLAWSEGLVTFMPIALQNRLASPGLPFPAPLFGVGDDRYSDTENQLLNDAMESPGRYGFASELSVMGLLWDLFDTHRDLLGAAADEVSGYGAAPVWSLITRVLPCDPCDRVDRFWNGLVNRLGGYRRLPLNPLLFRAANLFVVNGLAPRAIAPGIGQSLPGGLRPTFSWSRNGDTSPAHRNNQFVLAFSRDGFQSHAVLIRVPVLDASSYQPTEAEWNRVLAGGRTNALYYWFVLGHRADTPVIPENAWWFSNVLTFRARSLHLRITWSPRGADVDLHLAPPTGSDIAYYNRNPGWGVLDRDCITTCTEENISVAYLPQSGVYQAFAHYYSDHGRGPATVRAEVFNGGVRVVDQRFTLSRTGSRRTFLLEWLGRTDGTSDGAEETPILPGGSEATEGFVAPESLPPKSGEEGP